MSTLFVIKEGASISFLNRKIILTLLLVAVIFAPSISRVIFPPSTNIVLIGLQAPLSGSSALQGDMMRKGVSMAIDENKAFFKQMGLQLKIMPMDDQASTLKGNNNAQRLCNDPRVMFVVGHYDTGVAISSSSAYENCSLPLISPANTGNELTKLGKKTINRICVNDLKISEGLAYAAYHQFQLRRLGIIQSKTSYGEGIAKSMAKHFTSLGGLVVDVGTINAAEEDFSGTINSSLVKKPDAIFCAGLHPECGVLFNQAREKGFTGRFLSGEAIDTEEILEIAGKNLDGVVYATMIGDINTVENGRKFSINYRKKYKSETGAVAVNAYAAADYGLAVIKKSMYDKLFESQCGQRAFLNKRNFINRHKLTCLLRKYGSYQNKLGTKINLDQFGENQHAPIFLRIYQGQKYPGKMIGEYDPLTKSIRNK